ncbi:uncharacterized protein [Ptychodera flava]|uniref:uncharacterized protein n=1 Tax=Ptychodera flava TaxID=63121 RepID=UPI00396A7426
MKIKTRYCILVVLVYALINCALLLYSTVLKSNSTTSGSFDRIGKTRAVADVEKVRPPHLLDAHSKISRWKENGAFITYRINQKLKCFSDPTVTLLIIISSSPEEGARRIAVRETWARGLVSDAVGSTVVCLFSLRPTDSFTLQKEIDEESEKYNDIIQADAARHWRYSDDVFILHWVRNYCVNTRFILKVDDRTLVFTDRLVKYLTHVPETDFLGCMMPTNSSHGNIEQEHYLLDATARSRYGALFEEQACLLSIDVALRLAVLSQGFSQPILANATLSYYLRKLNLPVSNLETFQVYKSNRSLCEFKSAFLMSEVSPASMYHLWDDMKEEKRNTCNVTVEQSRRFSKLSPMTDTLTPHNVSVMETLSHLRSSIDDEDIFLLVLFLSKSRNANRRSVIRKTGGMYMTVMGKKVVRLFLVGAPPTAEVENNVKFELELFQDVVVLNTDDNSKSSLKISIMLKLAVLLMPPARYVMKVHDDVFINLHNLVQLLLGSRHSGLFLTAARHSFDNMPLNSKAAQAVPQDEGVAIIFVISKDVANGLYSASVELYGVCRHSDEYVRCLLKQLRVSPIQHNGFDLSGTKRSLCEAKEALAVCNLPESVIFSMWRKLDQWGEFVPCPWETESRMGSQSDEGITIKGGRFIGMQTGNAGSFKINHVQTCYGIQRSELGSEATLLIALISRPGNQKLRQAIRKIWGMYNETLPFGRIRTLFFVAMPENAKTQAALREEDQTYGDIIQVNFIDSYKFLVLKTLSIFLWASEFCRSADYLVKVDDDVFLHYGNLIEVLQHAPRTNFYMGDVRAYNFPYRSIDSEWFTPAEAWPDKPYPIFTIGMVYIISIDLAPKLLEQSTKMPAFKWEDIYVGMLMNQLNVVPYPHIHIYLSGIYRSLCSSKSVLAMHGFNSTTYLQYWKGLNKNIKDEECSGIFNEGTISSFSPRNGFQDLNESYSTQTEWYSPSVKIKSVFRSIQEEVFLLVVVMTTPTQYYYRRYFRIVYGRSSRVLGQNVIVRFVVDGSSDDSLQKFVLQENELYGDMVLLKAREGSNRASQRLSATLKWTATMDEPVKFVMVTEITVYLDIENVVHALTAAPDKNYVTCHVKSNSVAVRSKGSPWFVSFEDWEGDVYPPHCTTGTPFVVSFDVVLKMVDLARRRPIFKFPDVYMGILLREANLTLAHQDKFSLQPVYSYIDDLDQHFCRDQTMFSLQKLSPTHIDVILRKAMTKKKTKC